MKSILIATNLGLRYTLYHEKVDTIKENLVKLFGGGARKEELWAVRNLNFELPRGESLGVIGENGSGKSTLLKVLAGVIPPCEGKLETKGRVSALLELGAGFHPELSGYENLLLYGAIQGVSKKEMKKRIPRITAFAELENFIDIPVKNYSTGMYMRLGFAAAIDVEPDILLVDEVLAVGDQNFQAKCFERIQQLKREGVSLVFVSHDLSLVERICDKTLWIEKGETQAFGESNEVIKKYLSRFSPQLVALSNENVTETPLIQNPELKQNLSQEGTGDVIFDKISLCHPIDSSFQDLKTTEPFSLKISYHQKEPVVRPTLRIIFQGKKQGFRFDSFDQKYYTAHLSPSGVIECFFYENTFPPDEYSVDFEIGPPGEEKIWCGTRGAVKLNLLGENKSPGENIVQKVMFRASHDPFALSRCCRFHFLDAGLERDFATLDFGWYEVEFAGLGYRWTDQEAEWVIQNREGRSSLLLTVRAGYLKPGDKPLTGEVLQEGKSIGKFIIPDDNYHDLTFLLNYKEKEFSKMKLVLSSVFIPGEVSEVKDFRKLGVAVHKIRLI